MKPLILLIAIFPVLLACQKDQGYRPARVATPQFAAEAPQCKSLGQKVIYDEDDRKDWWQVQGMIKNYWAASTVALIRKDKLKKNEKSGYFIEEPSYGDQMRLCKGVPFFNQPQGAYCSGFLVAPNLVATAGHCVESLSECQETQFVFDFAKRQSDQVNYDFRPQDVYSCKRILHSDLAKDFSIIELTSPVVGRVPLNIRRSGRVKEDSELILIGHPAGLPSKIAGGAKVLTQNQDNFFASLDAFAGNSGSLVMGRSSGLVEGILVGGEPDFIYEDGCQKENICEAGDCFGEKVISIQLLKKWIPNTLFSPPNLENCQ